MEMWEAQDLSGADKVNLMSAAYAIPMTGLSNGTPRYVPRFCIYSQAYIKPWNIIKGRGGYS